MPQPIPFLMTLWRLRLRMYLAAFLLFALFYALFSAIGFLLLGGAAFLWFGIFLAFGVVFLQFLAGPKIVEWSMKVKYVSEAQEPRLHAIVEELARQAGLPKPRVGVSEVPVPNAFAFGRWRSDGRICVTRELMERVDEAELKGVLGHELSHLRHRDVAFMTLLQVVPLLAYQIYLYFFWSSLGNRQRNGNGNAAAAVGALAFGVYFLSNLLVLYANRLRELYADRGSVELTGQRAPLASALYKIVHGSARRKPQEIKSVEGCRALFMADPTTSRHDALDIRQADLNRDGRIDEFELEAFSREPGRIGRGERLMEALSTHPALVRRVRMLAEY